MSHGSPSRRRSPTVLVAFALLASAACEPRSASSRESAADFQELATSHLPRIDGDITVAGLQAEVRVVRDPWGVPHIYATNLDDLFFAQGFVQAQDRLWQMEMYRMAGEGRLSEIIGPEMLRHDRLARLLRFRDFTDEEFRSYHPEGRRILEAFARGVNAYVGSGDPLPVEFELTGIRPEPWTAETPLLRMMTAMPLGDARAELRLARRVAELGAERANPRGSTSPWRPLVVPEGVDLSIVTDEVADGLSGFENGMPEPDLAIPYAEWLLARASANLGAREHSPGSNNWVLSGALTASGKPIVANDPHRGVTNPSLRYVVHLDAPGWTAVGSTEPVLPGVAIGHNGRVAWGLTIVGTDQSDVYVEEVNPENPAEVRWRDGWEPLRIVVDTIRVKGSEPEVVRLEYSRHGPIFHRDTVHHRAYALRSTMHEPGATGYLAALRLNVVSDCGAFLEELRWWKAPTENMVCGDADGNIAWQASAASPRRVGWDGRLPVPGTGRYEWDGFRDDLPRELNPERGWIATANHDIHPPGYDPPLFFKSGTSFPRYGRVAEVLSAARAHMVEDSRRLQQDAWSPRGAEVAALFRGWAADDPEVERARSELAEWDGVFRRESRAAALYEVVRRRIPEDASAPVGADATGGPVGARAPGARVDPDAPGGPAAGTPAASSAGGRAELTDALAGALDSLRRAQGPDPEGWRWGRFHRSEFPHPLVAAYDLPAVERSGGGGTVAATGATYRQIVDFSNLDASLATNAPGQSGRPGSAFYGNLLESWADQEYFPLLFSREAVEANATHRLVLKPGG